MTKPCPPDLAAFKHEPANYEQPVEAVTPWTPGPWCIGDDEDVWDTLSNGVPGIPLFRADVGSTRSWGRKITRSELLANARLIAAAPALYEALEEVTDELAEFADILVNGIRDERMGGMVDRARAALSLARGETSHG